VLGHGVRFREVRVVVLQHLILVAVPKLATE
jgi:hypothetical protein